jgi:hypothetical protein
MAISPLQAVVADEVISAPLTIGSAALWLAYLRNSKGPRQQLAESRAYVFRHTGRAGLTGTGKDLRADRIDHVGRLLDAQDDHP